MRFTHSYELIQDADVVVGAGTIAAAAVACGKPTVMLGGHDCSDYIGGNTSGPTTPTTTRTGCLPVQREDGPSRT
jgi:hypothetical protein